MVPAIERDGIADAERGVGTVDIERGEETDVTQGFSGGGALLPSAFLCGVFGVAREANAAIKKSFFFGGVDPGAAYFAEKS